MILGLFELHIPSLWSLGIIVILLGIWVLCSIKKLKKSKAKAKIIQRFSDEIGGLFTADKE
jgi:cytochrome c-type biogenesis protein CcmH/NrfF